MEVIVVDSASTDGTPRLVRGWAAEHPDLKLKLVEEPARMGKAHALNAALRHVPGDVKVVVITDADSLWPQPDALKKAVSYFSDPNVGAVSCLKKPEEKGPAGVEEGYGDYPTHIQALPIVDNEPAILAHRYSKGLRNERRNVDMSTSTKISRTMIDTIAVYNINKHLYDKYFNT